VEIAHLELTAESADSIRFSLVCSPGTYMRSLARDIGVALDSAAHLAELQRIRSGFFAIENSRPLAAVLDALDNGEDIHLIGLRDAVPNLSEVEVSGDIVKRLRNGDSRALDGLVPQRERDVQGLYSDASPQANKYFKVIADDRLLAIAEATSRVTAVIARVFDET
jgi:tRNA pseudouridine55 synthase